METGFSFLVSIVTERNRFHKRHMSVWQIDFLQCQKGTKFRGQYRGDVLTADADRAAVPVDEQYLPPVPLFIIKQFEMLQDVFRCFHRQMQAALHMQAAALQKARKDPVRP